MAKTTLQLINSVGTRLRLSTGTTYTTINQDADAILINDFVNEAKRMVEAERRWNILREDITFSSVAGTQSYDTSDLAVVTSDPTVTNERSLVITDERGFLMMFDVTGPQGNRMYQSTRSAVKAEQLLDQNNSTDPIPTQCAIYPQGDGITVEFPYNVTAARDYHMVVYVPQADLESAATVMRAPERPVIFAAVALMAEERGEELGVTASTWWERYNSALSEAIIIDQFGAAENVLVPA